MKFILTLLTLCSLGYGGWKLTDSHPEVKQRVEALIDLNEVQSLEVRYSADHLMEEHRKNLLKKSGSKYLEPSLKFYPYLLLEVKFTPSNTKTKEALILWDLTDGEMVIDTEDWEKTHGFGDCIQMSVQEQEFKVLHFLAKKGKAVSSAKIIEELKTETHLLDVWLKSCIRKGLVFMTQEGYRLHLEKPKLARTPETRIDQKIITKPIKATSKASKRFADSKVERMARVAFGKGFSIRRSTIVYLPVYNITVQNPNGSTQTSCWNASTGKQLSSTPF